MSDLYVQYGCGFHAPDGWLNFDASPTLRFERIPVLGHWHTKNAQRFPENVRYGNIVKGLPLRPGSCAGIYCSHVLEHLTADDFDRALTNTLGYLKDSGVFRLVLPDLRQLAQNYLTDTSPLASYRFMAAASLGRKQRAGGFEGFVKDWLGNSAHQWMWDEKSLVSKLREHGFKDIRKAEFGDAQDRQFTEVEEHPRFMGAIAIQCRK